MAKLFATEAAGRIVDAAVQLHGGLGVVRGEVVERLYREVRALRIYEGTSEIQKLVIARSLLRARPRPRRAGASVLLLALGAASQRSPSRTSGCPSARSRAGPTTSRPPADVAVMHYYGSGGWGIQWRGQYLLLAPYFSNHRRVRAHLGRRDYTQARRHPRGPRGHARRGHER